MGLTLYCQGLARGSELLEMDICGQQTELRDMLAPALDHLGRPAQMAKRRRAYLRLQPNLSLALGIIPILNEDSRRRVVTSSGMALGAWRYDTIEDRELPPKQSRSPRMSFAVVGLSPLLGSVTFRVVVRATEEQVRRVGKGGGAARYGLRAVEVTGGQFDG